MYLICTFSTLGMLYELAVILEKQDMIHRRLEEKLGNLPLRRSKTSFEVFDS